MANLAEFQPGKIVIFCGPMFSGKTESLIDFLQRTSFAHLKSQAFKWVRDDRGEGLKVIEGKKGSRFKATPITESREILSLLGRDVGVVGIDEAQFLDSRIVKVVHQLSKRGLVVAIAGLPTDFRGEPFGSMPQLMAIAHEVEKRTAICTVFEDGTQCPIPATQTQRLINGEPACWDDPVVLVGGNELYTSRCLIHHEVPGKPKFRLSLRK